MKELITIKNLVKLFNTHFKITILFGFLSTTFLFYGCEDMSKLNADDKDSTQSGPCKTNHTGNLYFKNSMSGTIKVNLDGGGFDSPSPLTIGSGQVSGFLNIKAGSHSWDSRVGVDVSTSRSGNFNIVECKSDTIEIK